MESMTHQLQEKKKQIEEVSNSINNGYVFPHTTRLHMSENAKCKQKLETEFIEVREEVMFVI